VAAQPAAGDQDRHLPQRRGRPGDP
jgi:hypothetical protein